MKIPLERTTKQEQEIAQLAINQINQTFERAYSNDDDPVEIKIRENGKFFTIPKKALNLLIDILDEMANGKSIKVIADDTIISTQQAAEMLHVSRPHIVKLLDRGEIPFKKTGSHRRLELKNIIEYKEKLTKNRQEKLDFLAKQAQELNLGY